MTLKTVIIIASASLLALVSCRGYRPGTPRVDQDGKTAIVAHRGFWNCEEGGYATNSIASLKAAQDRGFWGSEFDVRITADGVVIVFHDDHINGERIDTCTASHFAAYRLPNGEAVPTLDDYLRQGARSSATRLVMEFKAGPARELEDALVDKSIAALKAHGLLDPDRVAFISFSRYICERVAVELPEFTNQYLNGDISPEDLASSGINGLSYNQSVLLADSTVVSRARKLGLSSNVWTVNGEDRMRRFVALGLDAITTDEPMLLRGLLEGRELLNVDQ